MGFFDFLTGATNGGSAASPYEDAMKQYQKYNDQAIAQQQPYYQAGQTGLTNYQNYLSTMQNPMDFINKLLSGYSQSPYAKNLQSSSIRAAQNAASADGTLGSTPFANHIEQNAANISEQDMNQWLQNVLGINTAYGQGQNQLAQYGQGAANILSQLYGNQANEMADLSYGRRAGLNQDNSNDFAGILSLLGGAAQGYSNPGSLTSLLGFL